MAETFDFVVVGAGSAGAVVAARLSEDPSIRVCLLEAGGKPPAEEAMPAACAGLQKNPVTDWIYSASGGEACQGLVPQGKMHQPRGKMLGGCSGINYMAWVRGHPGDFEDWKKRGAEGWGFDEVLKYYKKLEGFDFPKHVKEGSIVLEEEAHGRVGPLGVSIRDPILPGTDAFLAACQATGLPLIDYNGLTRGGPAGGCSHFQLSTERGVRSSTYRAYLEPAMARPNLTIITGVTANKVLLDSGRATGVEYKVATGETTVAMATKEVVLSCGAFGSPAMLLRSGIGPEAELQQLGIQCFVDNAHVGKHLKDHLMCAFHFPSAELGVSMLEVLTSFGPDALRSQGVLPASAQDDAALPPELKALKMESERQLAEFATTGKGLQSSSLYDGVAFYNTGLGDAHTHDAELAILNCGYSADIWQNLLSLDIDKYFGSREAADKFLGPESKNVLLIANPVQPHSEGEVRLTSADPMAPPHIDMNYLSDPHDMKVFKVTIRKTFEIAKNMPQLGPWFCPVALRHKHRYKDGDEPSDDLIEDIVRHFALTVYHPTSTCRIGDVVDPHLRVKGIQGLRVVDASVMPNIISGNPNAPCIMIGERGAELIAAENGVALQTFVGPE